VGEDQDALTSDVSGSGSGDHVDDRPIFVVGFQRSGTTLLQALLGSHSRIAAPPETYFIFRIADFADYYGDLQEDVNLRRALHDLLNPPLPLFDECGFDEERLFERARAGDRTYPSLFDTMMRDYAERMSKVRWSDKTPGQPAGRVLDLFPDAQIVHILRDPRDVIASSLETPWTKANAAKLAEEWRRFTLENIAVGRASGEGSYMEVRYEELTRDPDGVLRAICAFLGEVYDPEMTTDRSRRKGTVASVVAPWQARALDAIAPSREGGWRDRLSRLDRARIAAILSPEIASLRYQPFPPADALAGRCLRVAWRLHSQPRPVSPTVATDPAARHRELDRFLSEGVSAVERWQDAEEATERGRSRNASGRGTRDI